MARSKTAEPPSSFVRHNLDGSTDFIGALATRLYQAQCLRARLSSPLGALSNRKLLVIAQAFTGRRYGSQETSERLRAIDDLDDWIKGYELIVPVLEETD